MATRTLTRAVKRFDVWVSRLKREGLSAAPTAADYDDWVIEPKLMVERVDCPLAPGYAKATLQLNLAVAATSAWKWKSVLMADDRVAIVENAGAGGLAYCAVWFAGFVVEGEPRWGASDESCFITAVSNAFRLARDANRLVYGREMKRYDDSYQHYNGFVCAFNTNGKYNRADGRRLVTNGPDRDVAYFTSDGVSDAVAWTLTDAAEYLMWQYNADQVWVNNHRFVADDYTNEATPLLVDCNGKSLWEALAAVAGFAGWDVYERFALVADGGEDLGYRPYSQVRFIKRGHGTARTVNHQDRTAANALVPLDLAETNLFTSQIADSVTNSVTAPVALGASEMVELTIPLQPAWNGANLSLAGTAIVMPGHEAPRKATSDYVKRYVTSGELFAAYADVGRVWDANTDGRYSGAPWYLTTPDVATLAQGGSPPAPEAGTWPRIEFKPYPLLSKCGGAGAAGPSGESLLEISYDSGQTWEIFQGDYQLLPDRLGVRLTAANLAKHVPLAYKHWSAANNLVALLASVAAPDEGQPWVYPVRMRLTISVAAPNRARSAPDNREHAGTFFRTGEFLDRGEVGGRRRVAASSTFAVNAATWNVTADGRDDIADLDAIAADAQEASELAVIEASIPLEWADETIEPTDVVSTIGGINYSLAADATRLPRVVSVSRMARPESWSMTVTLGSYRKAPVL